MASWEEEIGEEAGYTRGPPFRYNKDNHGYCVGLCVDFRIHVDEDHTPTVSYAVPCFNCHEDAEDELMQFLFDLSDDFNLPDYSYSRLHDTLVDLYIIPAARRDCHLLPADRSAPSVTVHIGGGDPANSSDVARYRGPAVETLQPYHGPTCTCSICLEDTRPPLEVCVEMPCGHAFHKACLHVWLNRHHTCPYCRFELLV